jgi:hypothetical protein
MAIDPEALLNQMVTAAAAAFKGKWPDVKDYATSELNKIAQDIAFIEAQRLTGAMTEEQAKLQLHLQTNASKIVLLAAHGMTILAVEAAINAALSVVKDTVNKALGFVIL